MKAPSSQNCLNVILVCVLVALIGATIILACVPPVSRDALTHHLAVPKLYLEHGGMYEIPALVFSYYPMNLNLLYMISLYFGNDIIPKIIHLTFALFTAWLIFSFLKRRCDMAYAMIGVLFFLSLPIIVKLSITAYVDLGLVFFSTAALLSLFKWMENSFKLKYLIISAIWCGLALGTKYNGLVLLFLFVLFVPLIYSRKMGPNAALKQTVDRQKKYDIFGKACGYATVYMIIALVMFSPWATRNYIWINNPIYPLYDNWFNADNARSRLDPDTDLQHHVRETSRYVNQFTNPFVTRKVIFKESVWQILMIPLRVFFQGKDDDPKYFDGRLNPYLLLLPFFAFFPKNKDNAKYQAEKKMLLGFSVLFLLIVFFQRDLRIRYIAPIIPPLVILSTFGLRNLIHTFALKNPWPAGRIRTGFVAVGIAVLICMNIIYIWGQFKFVQPISYISGKVGRDTYIEKYRPEYATIRFANQYLPEDAKLFCLFLGDRGYYSDREMFFGDTVFSQIVKRANSAERLWLEFHKNDLTHLLIRYDVFNQWSGHQFNGREKGVLAHFFKGFTTLIFAKGGYGLYRL
ncbi:MAG: glycosyltransferase family 39 protein [Desulfobacterales bacterium]|jgi:hypothetical protein